MEQSDRVVSTRCVKVRRSPLGFSRNQMAQRVVASLQRRPPAWGWRWESPPWAHSWVSSAAGSSLNWQVLLCSLSRSGRYFLEPSSLSREGALMFCAGRCGRLLCSGRTTRTSALREQGFVCLPYLRGLESARHTAGVDTELSSKCLWVPDASLSGLWLSVAINSI